MAFVLLFSASAVQAVQQGLQLCAASVVPALFPFLVFSSLFMACGGAELLGYRLQNTLGHILGCSGAGVGVFFLSILGGYPVGARLIGQLFRTGQLSLQEAEHLLLFCNNAGPAFILGFVGLGQMNSTHLGIWLYLVHVAAASLTAVLFRPKSAFPHVKMHASASEPFSQALVTAIGEAGSTMVQVCAFVTFFYTLLQLFSNLTGVSHPLVLGFVELTRGILQLRTDHGGFVIASALLGWGGLSVHCQTAAVLSGTGISLKNHLRGKMLHSIFATVLGFFAWFLIK
jgi:sporulation integral membrane protein YlbJ